LADEGHPLIDEDERRAEVIEKATENIRARAGTSLIGLP
jgi:hypothetical protein